MSKKLYDIKLETIVPYHVEELREIINSALQREPILITEITEKKAMEK